MYHPYALSGDLEFPLAWHRNIDTRSSFQHSLWNHLQRGYLKKHSGPIFGLLGGGVLRV